MATPTPPYILEESTPYPDTLARINDNFRNVVQDLGSLGTFTGFATAQSGATSLLTTESVVFRVDFTSSLPDFAAGASLYIPLINIYVDVDNTAASLLGGSGSTLTAAQKKATFGTAGALNVTSGATGTYLISLRNNDSGTHTYYVYASVTAAPATNTSAFR